MGNGSFLLVCLSLPGRPVLCVTTRHAHKRGPARPVAPMCTAEQGATMPACVTDFLGVSPWAGTRKEEVGELLAPLLTDNDVSMEVAGFAALSLGLVFVGDCHAASAEAMLQVGRH